MSEIPEDVMEQAEDYYESVLDRVAGDTGPMPVGGWRGEYIRTFAKAILAEREFCAKIAENFLEPVAPTDEDMAGVKKRHQPWFNDIAAAIRQR